MAEWAAKELPTYPYDLEACVRTAYERNWEDFGKLMWMFLPPVLILIFGSAVAWTIQGFRPGVPEGPTHLSHGGASYEGGAWACRPGAPRNVVPTNRLREGPTSPLH